MAEALPSVVGRQILKARMIKGWNQGELAKATNIPQSTISRYENAERHGMHPANLIKIAEATGVTVDFLLGRYEAPGVAERIAKARALKGFTQRDLADALGLPLNTLRRFEVSGDQGIDISRIPEIAEITGVSIDYLLGRDL